MDIQEYIKEHLILQIGAKLPNHICSEIIVDDPREFVEFVIQCGYHISHIFWWERVAVNMKPVLGYGGSYDPRTMREYYFAETDMADSFSSAKTVLDYLNYMDQILKTYGHIELFPAFEVPMRGQGQGDGFPAPPEQTNDS